MGAPSRRKFLTTAGVGAAAVGVASAVPSLASTGSSAAASTEKLTQLQTEVVVTVVDAAKGEFHILIGERAIPVTDLAFASKIAQAIA